MNTPGALPFRPCPSSRTRIALLVVLAALCLGFITPPGRASAQDTGWEIDRFVITIDVDATGILRVRETINVDFGNLERHGIFRNLTTRFECSGEFEACPEGYDRIYLVSHSESRINGEPAPLEISQSGSETVFRLGDPDVTVTGVNEYQITYEIRGALNRINDLDELYWNITGTWPVPVNNTRIEVFLPVERNSFNLCYQGRTGSTATCPTEALANGARYRSAGPLNPGEQITIVLGWEPGIVQVDQPILEERFTFASLFTFDSIEWGVFAGLIALSFLVLLRLWWMFGRDREFTSVYYLTNDPTEQTRPMFARRDVVIEYLPPGDWRPAQMGVVLDERADTLDVTATIIDLAVRGYLTITEIPKQGWFGKLDWRLDRTRQTDADLAKYEASLLDALFDDGDSVLLSDLKNVFYKDLAKVKRQLYRDALQRHWFRVNPETVRSTWRLVGVGIILAGAGLVVLSALTWDRALMFTPIVLLGLILLFAAPMMPRRTAVGSEALRRILGFRLYVTTAETRMQEFNEQQGIFARYLPYAIVFGCVDKWAKAFRDLGADTDDAMTWYHGTTPLRAAVFASHINSFSGSLSSAISSTPGSSGSSGFSGGSSGGGGGGGGGGSW